MPGSRVSEMEQRFRDMADAQPMVVRCCEPGCEDFRFDGPAAEGRAAAAAHQEERHPELAAERASRRRRRKKIEDARVAAQKAQRPPVVPRRRERDPSARGSFLTDDRLRLILTMNREGRSVASLAREFYADWGYKTAGSCEAGIHRAFIGRPDRPVRPPPVGRRSQAGGSYQRVISPETEAWIVAQASNGVTVDALVSAHWQEWGYANEHGARSAVGRLVRAHQTEIGTRLERLIVGGLALTGWLAAVVGRPNLLHDLQPEGDPDAQ